MANHEWDLPGDDWVRRARRVCDDKTMADIVNDNRPPPPARPASTVTVVGSGKVVTGDVGPAHRPYEQGGSGWQEPPKVDSWRPPGVEIMDQMMDQQDAIDRAARIRELADAAAVQRALSEPKAQEPKARGDKK
jgi:hypothetical protein